MNEIKSESEQLDPHPLIKKTRPELEELLKKTEQENGAGHLDEQIAEIKKAIQYIKDSTEGC